MKRPALLLILLVVLPLALLGATGWRLLHAEQRQVEDNVRRLLSDRLREYDRTIAAKIESLTTEMQSLANLNEFDPDSLRDLSRRDARLSDVLVIGPDDEVVHPDPRGPVTSDEREFLVRAAPIIRDRQLRSLADRLRSAAAPSNVTSNNTINWNGFSAPPVDNRKSLQQVAQVSLNFQGNSAIPAAAPGHIGGWFTWYWGPGLHLIYWEERPSGHLVALVLERSRWMADIIAALPDTPLSSPAGAESRGDANGSRIQLVDAGTSVVYQWGSFVPPDGALPAAEIHLSGPLAPWTLRQFVPPTALVAGQSAAAWWLLAVGLGSSGLALGLLAWVLHQQYARELREAAQRVSFVNQVSHELRTPLTNIRMYAELLAQDLSERDHPDAGAASRVDVILSESNRLTRLIGNVLTFSRQQRGGVELHPQPTVPDELICTVLAHFAPALERHRFQIETELHATRSVLLDRDACEQILVNLLGNVEKYACGGRWLGVRSSQTESETLVEIRDRGPGVPEGSGEKVFEPFWRGSTELHQAAGTGIGLTIARDLARKHGGDVRLAAGDTGACFEVTLRTPQGDGMRGVISSQ